MMTKKLMLWAATALALSGCAVGPDFKKPAPPAPTEYGQAGKGNSTQAVAGSAEAAAAGPQSVVQVFKPGQDIPRAVVGFVPLARTGQAGAARAGPEPVSGIRAGCAGSSQ
nr:hypothetical protein [Acetobacter malorum]